MKEEYFSAIAKLQKLHSLCLDVVKKHLEALEIKDISPQNAIMLCHIGEQSLTPLSLVKKGHNTNSNPTYNLKLLKTHNYTEEVHNLRDHRSYYIKLSPKGLALCKNLNEIFEGHARHLTQIHGAGMLTSFNDQLKAFQIFLENI